MNHKELNKLQNKILKGLADFYYEPGYKYEAYRDDKTGGVYEHKLAHRMGFQLADGDKSPPEFLEACRCLEDQGYVRRLRRKTDFSELGIWPTPDGLDRAEYLQSPFLKKSLIHLQQNWPQILISVVTTLLTLLFSWMFGLFGLRS